MSQSRVVLMLAVVLCAGSALAVAEDELEWVMARVESCRGCSLNRLPEVKKFIYKDLPEYIGVEFKPIQGAPPELVLLGPSDEEIERIPLSQLSRDECNELLKGKGFERSAPANKNEL